MTISPENLHFEGKPKRDAIFSGRKHWKAKVGKKFLILIVWFRSLGL
jgi:hypothetical protein